MGKHRSPWAGARKFDSKFEKELLEGPLKGVNYHLKTIEYDVKERRKYTPDFTFEKNGIEYLIEAKGRFRTHDEAKKYLHVKEALSNTQRLVFLFYNPKTPMPNAKARKKCGTKRSVSEWAESHEFEWYTKETIKRLLNEAGRTT